MVSEEVGFCFGKKLVDDLGESMLACSVATVSSILTCVQKKNVVKEVSVSDDSEGGILTDGWEETWTWGSLSGRSIHSTTSEY